MADPVPALLAEQLRLQPMLDRLLNLAAQWADPPSLPPSQARVEPGAPAADKSSNIPVQALAFAGAWNAQSIPPAAASADVARPAQPGLPQKMSPPISPSPAPAAPSATAETSAVAYARLSRPAQQQPAAGARGVAASPFAAIAGTAPAQRPPSQAGLSNPEPARPVSSNQVRPATPPPPGPILSWSAPSTNAPAGVAGTGGLARLGMVLAATGTAHGTAHATAVASAPTSPAAGAARMSAAGPAPSQKTMDAAPRAIPIWPAATLRDATAATAAGVAGGDTLEDRLADILERAAAEAGVLLP